MKPKLYDIVKAKFDSAINHYEAVKRNPEEVGKAERILGQSEAYFDIMILIATGGVDEL